MGGKNFGKFPLDLSKSIHQGCPNYGKNPFSVDFYHLFQSNDKRNLQIFRLVAIIMLLFPSNSVHVCCCTVLSLSSVTTYIRL